MTPKDLILPRRLHPGGGLRTRTPEAAPTSLLPRSSASSFGTARRDKQAFGGTYRVGKNLERDLGIPLKRQINNAEHVTADVEHGQLLLAVAPEHCHTEEESSSST